MSAAAQQPVFYAARPTLTVAGREEAELAVAVNSLVVTETSGGLYTLEATFGNWGTHQGDVGFLYFDRQLLEFGAELSVDLGGGESRATVFSGRISAIEGRFPTELPPEILVLAEDRLFDLRMTRRTRSFENVTTSDVVDQIAQAHGLQADADIDPITYATVVQLNQSDLAFLRDLARAVDAEIWVDGQTLKMQARSRRPGDELSLVYGQTLQQFSVVADLAHQCTRVLVSGWDIDSKQEIEEVAEVGILSSELDGGTSGGSILQEKFEARTDHLVHHVPLTSAEALSLAEARLRTVSRRFLTGKAVAEGDGRIRVGARVSLSELGPLFNGSYYVCEAQHIFDAKSGYRTRFSVERSGLEVN